MSNSSEDIENYKRLAKEISNVKQVSSMKESELKKILDLSFFAFKYIYQKELTVSTEFHQIDIKPPTVDDYLIVRLINEEVDNIKNKRNTKNNVRKLPSIKVTKKLLEEKETLETKSYGVQDETIVKNWLIVYDYSKSKDLQQKVRVVNALEQAKINGQYYAMAQANTIEVTTNKKTFIEFIADLAYNNIPSNLVQTATSLTQHRHELIQKKINAVLYIGYDNVLNNKNERLQWLTTILNQAGINLIESKFIIIPENDTSCNVRFQEGPDFICAKSDELLSVIQSIT